MEQIDLFLSAASWPTVQVGASWPFASRLACHFFRAIAGAMSLSRAHVPYKSCIAIPSERRTRRHPTWLTNWHAMTRIDEQAIAGHFACTRWSSSLKACKAGRKSV